MRIHTVHLVYTPDPDIGVRRGTTPKEALISRTPESSHLTPRLPSVRVRAGPGPLTPNGGITRTSTGRNRQRMIGNTYLGHPPDFEASRGIQHLSSRLPRVLRRILLRGHGSFDS